MSASRPFGTALPHTRRVGVRVTFLRMDRPGPPPRDLPAGADVVRLARCTLPFYRYLYATVGAPHVWWLRRTLSDDALAAIIGQPTVSIHVLYRGGEPAGFFELDRKLGQVVNLSYFGLMPHAVGQGLGSAFLGAAVRAAWSGGTQAVTVNTCTADHPRAMPGYCRAGFVPVRTLDEIWDVPIRLGLSIPPSLLI